VKEGKKKKEKKSVYFYEEIEAGKRQGKSF
jgi:hypothetical protein